MRLSCRLASGACLAIILATGIAEAQSKPPARSSSQFTLRRDEAAGAEATAARSRARAGDCAGALPMFDAAVRTTIEPTLRRDRGLCHDKLGHPWPAIEDFRAYLLLRPEANDAEQIRQRLGQLEEQVGVGGTPAQPAPVDGEGSGVNASGSSQSSSGSGSVSGSVSLGGGANVSSSGSGQKSSGVIGPRAGEPERSYDYYRGEEKLSDTAEESPLRRGSGAIIGLVIMPFRSLPVPSGGLGTFTFTGYSIAGSLRYSTGPLLTLNAEVGYAGFGTVGRSSALGGLQTMGGVEFRVPLSKFAADLLHFGIGVGYERYSSSDTDTSTNLLHPRGRVGYRHVFGPSFGLEAFVDGGPAFFLDSGETGFPFIGAGLALLVGGEGGT